VMYLNADYYFDNLRVLNRRKIAELLPLYDNKRMVARVARMFKQ